MFNPSLLSVAPMRLTHRSRRSSRASEYLLQQRWDLEQYKDSGQNYDLEGFFAYRSLISRTDFHNRLTLLLRTQHLDTFCIHGATVLAPWEPGLILLKTRSWSFTLNLKSSRDSCSLIRTIVRLLADFKHGCSHTDCSNHGNLCARGSGSKSSFVFTGSQCRHSYLQSFGSRNLSPARKGCLRRNLKWPPSLNFILTSKLRHNPVVLKSV